MAATVTGLLLVVALSAAGNAGAAAVLTSTTGNVFSGGEIRVQHDVVSANERIELEGNATASLIVDGTAIVRLCHGASLGFASDGGGRTSALDLRTGQLMISSALGRGNDPLEIHTPAATASLLRTEAHVEVDLLTGDTVITSLSSELRVNGVGANAVRSVVISAGERVTIKTGFGPGAVEAADAPASSDSPYSSACLDDARYRIAAVAAARGEYAHNSVSPIALMDLEGAESVPTVAAGPPIIPTGTLGPPGAPVVRPCLSYQQCVQASRAAPIFVPGPRPVDLPQPPP